MPASIQ
jgi:short-subunit dehydrogenase